MTILTTTKGQKNLPRYFAAVFARAQKMRYGRLDVTLPDGRVFRAEGAEPGPVAAVTIHNGDAFARLIRDGDLGFSEAYLDGWWSTPDLQAFMDLLHADPLTLAEGFPAMRIVRAVERVRFWLRRNTRAQARRNIARHYDLGNDFYAAWLDETMTYSSAVFETGQESLDAAQRAKYDALIDRMNVAPGDHVLEIGCGWGGFAEYAARDRGLRVTALTISRAQHDYATRRIAEAGLSDRVEIRLQDYRDSTGRYDAVASIEMFEAVGERYWPVFFATLKDRLNPGATAALQVITVPDDRFARYRDRVDFIQKYIFPGGMLPSPGLLHGQARAAGMDVVGATEYGPSYDQTLRRWVDSFNDHWEGIARLGFDDAFRRMWNYYLTSCAACFRFGLCNVQQVALRAPG